MADINDLMRWLTNGQIYGIPVIVFFTMVAFIIIILYLALTRKAKPKEFKPLDLKKETRRRYNKQFSYFGKPLNKPIYATNDSKPFGWIVGYMKVVWVEEFKRYEPVHPNFDKNELWSEIYKVSQEIYKKEYKDLDPIEKKNAIALAKENIRDREIKTESITEKTTYKQGKKEVKFGVPIPVYLFKVTHNDFLHKLIAKISNIGTSYFLYDAEQIDFLDDRLVTTADFQVTMANENFIFSKAGKQLVQDIAYGIERENIWQETANQIPRAVHFDTEASKALIMKREEAKITDEHFKRTKESNE